MGLKILVCVKDSISLKDESFRQFQIPVFSSCIVYPYIPIPLLSSTFFYFQIVCPYIYYIIIKLKLLSIEWLHPGIYNTKDLVVIYVYWFLKSFFWITSIRQTFFPLFSSISWSSFVSSIPIFPLTYASVISVRFGDVHTFSTRS